MLSKPKFIGKVLSNTITGHEQFSPIYLHEYELKHITITLTKDDFILPKFRKRNESLIFDFFFPLILTIIRYQKKIKEITEPSRDELTIAEKEIAHKKNKLIFFDK